MAIVQRRCFISYHHADQVEVQDFIQTFHHEQGAFTGRGLGLIQEWPRISSTATTQTTLCDESGRYT
jgi:hypothetical protein